MSAEASAAAPGMSREAVIAEQLAARHGGRWQLAPAGGSGFVATFLARGEGAGLAHERLFVKATGSAGAEALEAEADGLAALRAASGAAGGPGVPRPLGVWQAAGLAVLVMEALDFRRAPADFGEALGHRLGRLHRAAAPGGARYGWHRDNRCGATLQPNRWSDAGGLDGWLQFFGRERLGALAARLPADAAHRELAGAVGRVIDHLPRLFDDGHVPRPSLIHGDLWSGNWAWAAGSAAGGAEADPGPVIYDPAVSCSDAEAELAMMELFGRPPPGFWSAYRSRAGLAEGYARRRPAYQLYHLLNHALLFGGGYRGQARALAGAILARG